MTASLLLDRFLMPRHEGGGGLRNADEIEACAIREVHRVLRTRCVRRTGGKRSARRTVLDYGMPDYLHLSPTSRADAVVLANTIRETIHAYVPSIQVDRVMIDLPRIRRDEVGATIKACVVGPDGATVPLEFSIRLGV